MPDFTPEKTWLSKFANAFRGIRTAFPSESSYYVHCCFTVAVIAVAAFFGVSRTEWCLLIVCITGVWTAETFNSSIEWLAKAVDREPNHPLGIALDIASGAVLLSSIGAATIGIIILGRHALIWFGW